MPDENVPSTPAPDDKDWTWVLSRQCDDCGFDPDAVSPRGVPAIVRDAGRRYGDVLDRSSVTSRPAADVWSPAEYVAHVIDVCDLMAERLGLILAGGGELVQFANWDQDETALAKQYWTMTAAQLAPEVVRSFDAAASAYERPHGEQWEWPARRSNGSRFTAGSLAVYFVHDIVHHLHDIDG